MIVIPKLCFLFCFCFVIKKEGKKLKSGGNPNVLINEIFLTSLFTSLFYVFVCLFVFDLFLDLIK